MIGMTIGIAITTYNRPQHLKLCLEQVKLHSPPDTFIYIADDTHERKGVASRKNECIEALWKKGCDYFFLLDDDCFPTADGWLDLYIQTSNRTKQEHLMYIPPSLGVKTSIKNGLTINKWLSGTLIFMTRRVVAIVGALMSEYGLYGHEHVTYSHRIHTAGFTSYGKYLSIHGIENYVYAMDHDTHLYYNQQLNHKPSITTLERDTCLKENASKMKLDTRVYRSLPTMGLHKSEPICLICSPGVKGWLLSAISQQLVKRGYTLSSQVEGSLCLIFNSEDEKYWSNNAHPKRYVIVGLSRLKPNEKYLSLVKGAIQVWETDEVISNSYNDITVIPLKLSYSETWILKKRVKVFDVVHVRDEGDQDEVLAEALRKSGLTVVTAHPEQYNLILQGRVIVSCVLDEIRIVSLLANGMKVVSSRDYPSLKDQVITVKDGDWVEACSHPPEPPSSLSQWLQTLPSDLLPWDIIESQ
ncbi:MAG: hypothetical protein WC208_13860 [Gallionella sp.]|jgi:hypothetical protein